ncbi:Unannotated [Lentimonas sp. CC11]|nr:Unannotated [Lentimonas sp. CC10]CAA7071392.1 Unannotated [Lentimonas sp. CC11]
MREGWPPRFPRSTLPSAEPQHRITAPAHRKDEAELIPPKQITAGGMASAPSAEPQHRSTAPIHCTSTPQRRGRARPSQTNHCGRDGLRAVSRASALNHCTSTPQRRGGARPSQTNHCGRDGLRACRVLRCRPPSLSTEPLHSTNAPTHRKDEAELIPPTKNVLLVNHAMTKETSHLHTANPPLSAPNPPERDC